MELGAVVKCSLGVKRGVRYTRKGIFDSKERGKRMGKVDKGMYPCLSDWLEELSRRVCSIAGSTAKKEIGKEKGIPNL